MSKWIITACCVLACCSAAESNSSPLQPGDVDTERRHADRFLDLLKRRPSFGTALERVGAFHVERGTLDELVSDLRGAPPLHSDSAVQHLIAGMLQIQHGQGADAVSLLENVELRRSTDPVVSQALALALRDAGEIAAAISAFERALKKQPTKLDRRKIYKDLARLQHRTGNTNQSLKVLQQLEAEFPGDRAVREDVARRLQQDGQLQPALARWQSLAADASSPDLRIQYRLCISDIQMNMGDIDKAQQTLEQELSRIRPGSWLDEVVHRKMESVLLRSGGRQRAMQYYRDRLADRPDDVASVTRLAALLASEENFEDAASVYRGAIKRLPSSVKLRTALIDLLVLQGNMSEAVTCGRDLLKLEAAGTDEYELVGRLMLQDPAIEEAERAQQASHVWMMICGNRQDAATLGYVARLHHRSGLPERATELFRELTALDPNNVAWREELGETLYELGRREAAVRAWNVIAEGSRRNTRNLARVSEILEKAGGPALALRLMQQACELQPEISDRIRLARLLREVGQREAAYSQLSLAAKQARSAVDQRIIIEAKTEAWKQDPMLHVQVAELRASLEQNVNHADTWLQLALIFQIDQRLADAVRSIEQATTVDDQSIPAWQAACDVYVAAGLLDRAAAANRQLADLSPANRTQALQQVVHLERQLGRTENAMRAAEVLVSESPGHPDSCRQFADMCFATGRENVGLNCLQRCLRLNPDDDQLSIELAEILAERFQSADAESILWRSLARADNLDRRLVLIEAMIKLAKQTDATDRVIERLTSATDLDPVERSLCVASAWRLIEDPPRAQAILEQASLQSGRDLRILKMQVELAEAQNQLELAARYQQQLSALSPSPEHHIHLADLQFRTGQLSESELSWIRDARSGQDTSAAIRSIDRFLDAGRVEAAELMNQRLATDRPGDWRVLYRLAVIQWRLDRRDQAASTLQKIIDLDLPADHVFVGPQSEPVPISPTDRRTSHGAQSSTSTRLSALSPLARRASQIVNTLNWLQLYTGNELYSQTLTAPMDYGGARSAAVGLLWLHMDFHGRQAVAEKLADATGSSERDITDWCGIVMTARHAIQTAPSEQEAAGMRLNELIQLLAGSNEVEHQLVMVGLQCGGGVFRSSATGPPTASVDTQSANQLMAAAETVTMERPEWLADIGGWPVVYRHLESGEHSLDWADLIARLSDSPRPATLASATDLAFASRELSALAQCIRRSLALRSQIQISESLNSRPAELSELAMQFATQQDWKPVGQLIDLLLELKAARCVPVTDPDSGQITGYRLESNDRDSQDRTRLVSPRAADAREPNPASKTLVGPGRRDQVSGNSLRPPYGILTDARSLIDDDLGLLLLQLTSVDQFDDQAEAVIMHLEATARDQTKKVWIPAALALSRIYAVQGRFDSSMLTIISVVEQLPENVGLHLVLARYLHHLGADADALLLMNQLPVQHRRDLIVNTESLVLELCVGLQDQQRARLAASRLFELRLDPAEVGVIAAQLNRVGLSETARRFTARIPQAPAGRAEGLHRLMRQYFDDGLPAAAARIAKQFILQPSVTLDDSSVAKSIQFRRDAMQMLAECQAVKPVIRQLQVRLADQVAAVHQRHLLVELLRLDGRDVEAEHVAQSLRQSLIEHPDGGLQLARQLERQGRLESACDVCRYLLEADTSLFHRDYYRFIRLFERNGRLDELADLVMLTDPGENTSGHWGAQQLAERLLPVDEARGLQLFAAAWDAWPAGRPALLSNVSHEAIWRLPRVFDYYRERMLPSQHTRVAPWSGVADHLHVRGRGMVAGTLSRMLQVSTSEGRSVRFLADIQEALTIQPDWHAGWIYMALLEAHLGQTDKAFIHLSDLLQRHVEKMPPMVAWITASELHHISADPLDPIVIRLLEQLMAVQESGTVLLKSGTDWHASPEFLLAQYYAMLDDSDLVESVVDRMLIRTTAQPVRPAHQPTTDSQAAFDELADLLQPQAPISADRLREWGRSRLSAIPNPANSGTPVRTATSSPVIQAIRERLLQHGT
ncbi:MAG: tetratricopeptide repeat protein [Planctomycetaceae bacterium]